MHVPRHACEASGSIVHLRVSMLLHTCPPFTHSVHDRHARRTSSDMHASRIWDSTLQSLPAAANTDVGWSAGELPVCSTTIGTRPTAWMQMHTCPPLRCRVVREGMVELQKGSRCRVVMHRCRRGQLFPTPIHETDCFRQHDWRRSHASYNKRPTDNKIYDTDLRVMPRLVPQRREYVRVQAKSGSRICMLSDSSPQRAEDWR